MSTIARAFPPGPTSALPGGLLPRMRRDPVGFFYGLARQYGPISHFKIGPQRVFLLDDPDLIQQVLVGQYRHFEKSGALRRSKLILGEGLLTSEGDYHLRQRRLVQPAFHKKRIASYAEAMVRLSDQHVGPWQDGARLDINREMMRLTLAIVGETLFGADVADDASEVEACVEGLLGFFDLVMMPFSELLMRLPTAANRRGWQSLERLEAIVYRLIRERRAGGLDTGDLLSMLLLSQDAETDGTGMSDQQVRDEALTLFLAGHETTANALTWAWYLLASHPEVRARMESELDQVLGGRVPSFEDLPSLVYTEQVLAESLRLYPPGWAIARKATADVPIGEWVIPKGAIVMMSPYITHRNPRFWPEPERFDPARWTPEAKAGRPKFAYFPFSGGPRGCIGEHFAWMEAMLILATLGARWRMRLAPGHVVGLEPLVTLRPKGGMPVVLEAR